jgi:hypothetical protein
MTVMMRFQQDNGLKIVEEVQEGRGPNRSHSSSCAQCTKGVMFSWAPYLLNQFLIDCRDAQDNGTEFHYSWLLILIALVGWKEPKFSYFVDRKGKCYAVRYETLWQAKDNKNQQENNTVFSMFLEDMQQKTTNVWRIPIEVVQENEGISSLRHPNITCGSRPQGTRRKSGWKCRYCASREEVDWIVKDWPCSGRCQQQRKNPNQRRKQRQAHRKRQVVQLKTLERLQSALKHQEAVQQ